MNIRIACSIWMFFSLNCLARLPENAQEYEIWEKRMLEEISNLKNNQNPEAIPKLGRWVMQLSLESNIEKGNRPVYYAARNQLLTLQGHAEYYAKRINEARAEVDRLPEDEKGAAWVKLQNEQMYGFRTLSQLPSPETVGVLGEFLYDERGYYPTQEEADRHQTYETGESANSERALIALTGMPLISKPVQARKYGMVVYDEDINAWRLWYEQIKAGTRTFRFEGDPQEYNLHGPVATSSPSPSTRPRSPGSPESHPSEKPSSPSPLVIWLATGVASLLCLIAIRQAWFRHPR